MSDHSKLLTTYCPECRGRASLVVDWQPPQGIDPRLRCFKCLDCGSIFYKVVGAQVIEQGYLITR